LVGRRLGAYDLEAVLGRGSMGVVYRARHATSGQTAAVKVLLDALANDMSFVTRFTREAQIVSELRHPNIIRLYGAGQDGGHIFFAMEYFHGSTVGQVLKQRGKLDAGQTVEIAAQAADALAYAHEHGRLVHRDIKPENLLVDRWCRVKVLDFGLARVEGLESITKVGTVVGSLYYVPPEQILGRKLDGRGDVYALGVSMYEMLTGQRPYRGRTMTEMTDAIVAGTPLAPTLLEPSIPPALEVVVLRAMARDREARYPDAGALCADLRALQVRAAAPLRPAGTLGPAAMPRPEPAVAEDETMRLRSIHDPRER
jgi:serine/threonine-protein kinase